MSNLEVALLGPPAIRWQGRPLSVSARKSFALLCYLAAQGTAVRKDEVAELLWGTGKSGNLRVALHGLRALPGAEDWLELDERLRLEAETDLAAFERALEAARYDEALAHWDDFGAPRESAGVFMQGFYLEKAPAFNDWLEIERSRVQALYLEGLQRRAEALEQAGRYAEALARYRRLLVEDPLNEGAHREVMRLEWLRNRPEAALRQFESCRRALAEGLGLEPLAATLELYERIEAGLDGSVRLRQGDEASVLAQPPPDPLIGRADERREVVALLGESRLVSLVGIGGVGKTRLALQLVEELKGRYPDGAKFVPLAALEGTDFMASAVASALGLSLSGAAAPEVQLVNYLQDKEMLLALDNLEHLLAGAGLLDELLAHCPKLTLLATSREVLDLPGEEAFRLRGLSYPREPQDAPLNRYDAVTLFVQRARNAARGFKLTPGNRAKVLEICRRLEGLPLGLELAAAWVGRMPLADIAADLASSLERLSKEGSDHKRHDSLRAALEASWQLLSPEEQESLAKLAVFRGGFERHAAEEIAGASHRTLLSLVNKSLLRRQGSGRFELHEVVRQFARTKLDDLSALEAAHSRYYLRFLQQVEADLSGKRQEAATRVIARELENARLAWQWATQARDATGIAGAAEALFRFYDIRALNTEAYQMFSASARAFGDREQEAFAAVLPRLKIRQAFFANRLSRFDEACGLLAEALQELQGQGQLREEAFAQAVLGAVAYMQDAFEPARSHYTSALERYQKLQDLRGTAIALDGLGTTAYAQGDFVTAESFYRQSLETVESLEDAWGTVRGLKNLGMVRAVAGAYDEARELLQRCADLCRQTRDQRALAGTLNNLGRVEHLLGDLEASVDKFEECIAIREQIGDSWGMALALTNLGAVRRDQGAMAEAKGLYQRALKIFERIRNQSGALLTLNRLGALALDEDDDAAAYRYFADGLELALQSGEWSGASDALLGFALLLQRHHQFAEAAALLTLVKLHPASEHYGVEMSEHHLNALKQTMPPRAFAAAEQRGEGLELEEVARRLLTNARDRSLDDFVRRTPAETVS